VVVAPSLSRVKKIIGKTIIERKHNQQWRNVLELTRLEYNTFAKTVVLLKNSNNFAIQLRKRKLRILGPSDSLHSDTAEEFHLVKSNEVD
jgi:hypothetical protein